MGVPKLLSTPPPADAMTPGALWRAFRRIPAGVTVAATTVDDRSVGMVVSSFTFVSMDPPLVGFFGDDRSTTFPAFLEGHGWGFSVLAQGEEEVADAFRRPVEERFADLSYSVQSSGAVLLDDALIGFDTAPHQVVPTGDHRLVLAEVSNYVMRPRCDRPMIYYEGRLSRLDQRPLIDDDHWDRFWDE
ncbi:flavin reductase family protein [Streptomyces sp. NPDC005811]|uniref:flavin reductase family protein n=1 Tax=Streptomyces sp. NPDC005811 TaxID=3154565 RepID=UPI0033E4CC09